MLCKTTFHEKSEVANVTKKKFNWLMKALISQLQKYSQ